MIKVTLNENLVPYDGRPAPSFDLTENLFLAKALIRNAVQFFHFDAERIRFSGFLADEPNGFSIEVWDKGKLYRTINFPEVGRSGVLKCEVMFGKTELAVKFDFIGAIYGAFGKDPREPLEAELTGA